MAASSVLAFRSRTSDFGSNVRQGLLRGDSERSNASRTCAKTCARHPQHCGRYKSLAAISILRSYIRLGPERTTHADHTAACIIRRTLGFLGAGVGRGIAAPGPAGSFVADGRFV